MTLSQLRYAITVADSRSMNQAAQKLSHNHHFKWWFVFDPIRVLCLHA